MTADDIRAHHDKCSDEIISCITVESANMLIRATHLTMLSEIAAQLAETNQYLKRIAYPLMEVKHGE